MTTREWTAALAIVVALATSGPPGLLPLACAAEPPKEQAGKDPPFSPYDLLLTADQAIQTFQQRVKRDPQDHQSTLLLVQMWLRKAHETGDFSCYEQAETVLRQAQKVRPNDVGFESVHAVLLAARHQFAESLQLAESLYKQNPLETHLPLIIGDAHLELGHYAEAEKAYQELLRKDTYATIHTRQSRLAELKGKIPEAIQLMQRAADEERSARVSRGGGAWYQVRLGDLHFSIGHVEDAGKHYEAALKFVPNCLPALAGLGRVRDAQGKDDEAVDLYKQAMAVSPESVLLTALGDLYLKTGNSYLAQVLHGKLERTARKQPAYNRELSLLYSDHDRKLPEALDLARKELAVRKDIYTYDALAWALCKNKRFEEAAKAMSEALKLGTQDANLLYHAGMIHLGRGERDKGRDYLEKALALNPHFSILHADQARQTLKEFGASVPPGKTGP